MALSRFFIFFENAFVSVLVFQLLFICIQAFYIRSKEYYYYASFILLIIIYSLAQETVIQYLPQGLAVPEHFRSFSDKPVVACIFVVYFRFARYFTDIPDNYPEFNKRIRWFEWGALLYATGEAIWLFTFGESQTEEIVFVIIASLMLFLALLLMYRFLNMQQVQLTRFILLGGFLLLLGAAGSLVLINLVNMGVLVDTSVSMLPYQIAALAELLVFTTGLAFKQHLIANQKLQAEKELVTELLEKESLQKNLQQVRNKIAGDLHDDVGATLGSINVYAGVSTRMINEGSNDLAKNYLKRIVELSTQSLNDMRHMLWALNTGLDSLSDLETRMKDYAVPLLASGDILLSFETEESLRLQKLSVLQKRNLFFVFKEALHNVMKYADCKKVDVKLVRTNDKISFTIIDNGKGFDVNALTEGNGLANMKRRAEEINGRFELSSSKHGTIIQLIF